VPVASELEAHLAEHADRPEAELLVQFLRGRIRQRIAANNAIHVFPGDGGKQRRIESAANPFTHGFVTAVHGRLYRGVVSRFHPKLRGAGVAHNLAVLLGHQQAMPAGGGELRKPRSPALHRIRLQIEGDGSMNDVVVIDLGQSRKIVAAGRAYADSHGTSSSLKVALVPS